MKNNFIHLQINQLLINIEMFSKWYHVNSINFMVSLAITLLDSWPWASNHRWQRGIIALSPWPAKQKQINIKHKREYSLGVERMDPGAMPLKLMAPEEPLSSCVTLLQFPPLLGLVMIKWVNTQKALQLRVEQVVRKQSCCP